MKRIIIILAFFILKSNNAFCQIEDVLSPSPTASALGKYVDNPVSLYTGTPSIAIPLYEIKMKEVSVPITLTYNPQDIQVETTPSNVGLGWSLNAGGVITRTVKDVPDDFRYDYANLDLNFTTNIKYLNTVHYNRWGYLYAISDGEPWHGDFPSWAGYQGTETYNLDLDAIYANRNNVTPETAILRHYSFPLWGAITADGGTIDLENWSRSTIRFRVINHIQMYTDLEPDIFYYNFNGHSGKFFFEVENGTPKIKTIPYQDLKVIYRSDATTGWITGFTIIDQQGVEYIFNNIERTTALDEDMEYFWQIFQKTTYNSSWWLTQIISPNGEVLNFNYENDEVKEANVVFSPTINAVRIVNTYSHRSLSELNYNPKYKNKITTTQRLSSVSNNDVMVTFNAEHTRQDIYESSAKAITSVEIKSNFPTKHIIKKIRLNYDYFLTDQNHHGKLYRFNGQGVGDLDYSKKRLRLSSVQEYGNTDNDVLPPTSFEYNYYDYNGNVLKKYPNRLTYDIDLWGYANNTGFLSPIPELHTNPNITPIPELHVYPDKYPRGDLRMFSVYEKESYTGRHFKKRGGNRKPNSNYMDTGVLTKITYPTGGSTSYEYEPHKFMLDGEEEIGGGLRIAKIVKDDLQGNKIIYNYDYAKSNTDSRTSGKIVSLPMFANLPISVDLSPSNDENALNVYARYYSYPLNELGRTHGSNVGYTRVLEYKLKTEYSTSYDNGFTEYVYSFPAEYGNQSDGIFSSTRVHNFFMYGDSRSNAELEYYPETSLSHLLPPNPNYDWNRGHLLKKSVFDTTGNLVKEDTFEYDIFYPTGQTEPTKIYGIKFAPFHPKVNFGEYVDRVYGFRVAKYEVLTDVAKALSKKTETEYFADGSSISKSINYEYNGLYHKNVTQITEPMSNGENLIRRYLYSGDFYGYGQAAVNDLYLNNRKNIPLEVSEYIKKGSTEYLRSSVLTTYDFYADKPYPNKQYKIESSVLLTDFQNSLRSGMGPFFLVISWVDKDDRYIEKVHYKKYDSKGNVLEIEDKTTGITTSYVWGYEGEYPIAKVDNAIYSEIESVLGSMNLSFLNAGYTFDYDVVNDVKYVENIYSDEETRNLLAPLRTGLPNAQVTTYTYKPLVGMTSETDPNGITTYYNYDNFNRLKTIKDYEGNIVSQYDYHYKNR